ncbi:MAG: HIT family protein [Bacteroidetes bacterium]|nr:HIT family protein [Bacteroidota bacterium]
MATIFSKIISGEIPSYRIAENENFVAFLDIFPLAKGHTLVVPRQEVDYYFDLDDQILAEMNVFCRKIALAIEKTVECERIGVAVIGLEVPHAHVHLIPVNNVCDINFARPKLKFSDEEFSQIAKEIRSHLE